VNVGAVLQRDVKPSICFIAHNALGALTGKNQSHVGGIERQQATMAKWLADRGWDVTVVTWDETDGTPERVAGIRIARLCKRYSGIPGLRFFYPRWTSLNSVLSRVSADLYYYNCGDLALGQIMLWSGVKRKPVIFSVPSDPDCDARLPSLRSYRERILYRFGLSRCRHIVAQSEKQQRMLLQHFSKESEILAMPCKGFAPAETGVSVGKDRLRVLWVGRLSPEKRVEWLLEVAKKMPDTDFTVVGAANQDSEYAQGVLADGKALPNVLFAGRVPYEQIADYYRDADILCCTSVYEGFPNVFLEGWSVGLPVVSTCDPDGIIEKNEIGQHVVDISQFATAIASLGADQEKRQRMSTAGLRYFDQHHSLDTAMQKFEEYFLGVHKSYVDGAASQ